MIYRYISLLISHTSILVFPKILSCINTTKIMVSELLVSNTIFKKSEFEYNE